MIYLIFRMDKEQASQVYNSRANVKIVENWYVLQEIKHVYNNSRRRLHTYVLVFKNG